MTTIMQVGATEFSTPSDTEIIATRTFDAPRDLVFDASHSTMHVPHWMLGPDGWTMPLCNIDLRPGGKWHFVWRNADGAEMAMHGTYREVMPPHRVVNTESWGSEWPETLNTQVFTETYGKTTVTCSVLYPSKEARDAALGTGMKEGWAQSYDRLEEYLKTMAE